jgi:MFS family permease
MLSEENRPTTTRVYWTAFIGLFFDYYDYYLFIYLQRVLETQFALSVRQSNVLQFTAIAGVGLGALIFGYLADRFGRGRVMLAVFGIYVIGIGALSLAWNYESLLVFRLIASLALGAEWGISHTFLSENVAGRSRYRFAALLQFSILGGLLAALASRYVLPNVGWRWLFAASIVPVVGLSLMRWRWLLGSRADSAPIPEANEGGVTFPGALRRNAGAFVQCLAIASLTIASGTVNVFLTKDLPQSPIYTTLFWAILAPSMLIGAAIVRRFGVRRALMLYAVLLVLLSGFAWSSDWPRRKLAFALMLPVLNGIPFGLMGAYFNEVFTSYRTLFSGAAYNLGRICAGLSPLLITSLGLQTDGNYFLFTAALGLGVAGVGLSIARQQRA